MTWWVWLIIITIVLLLAIWFIGTQRQLVHLDERCSNALSQIGVQQNTRWDALTALANLVKQYDAYEYSSIVKIIEKRQPVTENSDTSDIMKQGSMLTAATDKFFALGEAYPNLKASEMFQNTMNGVKQYEENVRLARMTYNDTVTKWNWEVRRFPDNLVAKAFHCKSKGYLDTPKEKTEMPKLETK